MVGFKVFGTHTGDPVQAAKLLFEAAFQLGPGGFDREPRAVQTRLLDNARTIPLTLAAPAPPDITCDLLKKFSQPTLVMRGEKTRVFYALVSEAISKCIPGAQLFVLQNVGHDGPSRDPAAFTGAVFEFLSRR
jgi:pimeloyl-ACP methyl ester carboxylesterase